MVLATQIYSAVHAGTSCLRPHLPSKGGCMLRHVGGCVPVGFGPWLCLAVTKHSQVTCDTCKPYLVAWAHGVMCMCAVAIASHYQVGYTAGLQICHRSSNTVWVGCCATA